MFLDKLLERNEALASYAFKGIETGEILPDTYILDLDRIVQNGKSMVAEAQKYNIELYFMLKQIGRNPLVGKALMDIGFKGAVVVDYKEAIVMIDNGIHISNVGHLVQMPKQALEKILNARPDYVTVYSISKIEEINEVCKKLGLKQKLLIRVTDDDSHLYSGQIAGFNTATLKDVLKKVEELENVEFGGITVFPALLYSEDTGTIKETENINAKDRAVKILDELGYKDYNVNLPSASCTNSIPLIAKLGGTSGEPGHGLTGTTPLHKYVNEAENVGYCYVSEVSHNFKDKAYCYGGGTYRRGHMENCLVGKSLKDAIKAKIAAPDMDSIDYHFEIDRNCNVSDTVLTCFRAQVFTTRSNVAVVEGLSNNCPKLLGTYNSLGQEIGQNWK